MFCVTVCEYDELLLLLVVTVFDCLGLEGWDLRLLVVGAVVYWFYLYVLLSNVGVFFIIVLIWYFGCEFDFCFGICLCKVWGLCI